MFSRKTNYKEYKEGREQERKEGMEEQGVIIYLLIIGLGKPAVQVESPRKASSIIQSESDVLSAKKLVL